MNDRAVCVALLLAVLPAAGCGTASNLAQPPEAGGVAPFGGVKHDLAVIHAGPRQRVLASADPTEPVVDTVQFERLRHRILCAVDLPFSFVCDAVLWPYTVSYSCINAPIPTPPMFTGPAPVPQPTAVESVPRMHPPEPLAPPAKLPPIPMP